MLLSPESKQALETMKCPRCGGKLHYRDVLNNGGRGGVINQDFFELFDVYGHSFNIEISELMKYASRKTNTTNIARENKKS